MFDEEKSIIFGVFIAAITLFILAVLVVLLFYNYFQVRMRKEKEILKAVFDAQESERNRISEDLHDDIGGKLSALKLHNELILSENLSPPAFDLVQKSAGQINVIVNDIRKIVRDQSSQYLLRNGLGEELHVLFSKYHYLTRIQADIAIEELPKNLSEGFQVSIFRIIQELLHNTIKHSGATLVSLRISAGPDFLEVFFSDNGNGFSNDAASPHGMGQNNIRTRIKLFNGDLKVSSSPKIETSFTMQFPSKEIMLAPVTGKP